MKKKKKKGGEEFPPFFLFCIFKKKKPRRRGPNRTGLNEEFFLKKACCSNKPKPSNFSWEAASHSSCKIRDLGKRGKNALKVLANFSSSSRLLFFFLSFIFFFSSPTSVLVLVVRASALACGVPSCHRGLECAWKRKIGYYSPCCREGIVLEKRNRRIGTELSRRP